MWPEFWIAVLVGTVFSFIPGFLIARGVGLTRIASVAVAPIVGSLCYCVLAIAYDQFGVWTTGWNLFAPLLVVGIAVFAVGYCMCVRRGRASEGNVPFRRRLLSSKYWYVALYAFVGLVAGIYVFLMPLSTPDCSPATFDDATHIAIVRSFVESGDYSSLGVNYEYDLPLAPESHYYPAAFHLIAASVISITGVPILVGINAGLFICCSFFYTTGCLFLVNVLFGGNKWYLLSGAFLAVAFVAFPWHLLEFGRLMSNLMAFAFVPAMFALMLELFGNGVPWLVRFKAAAVLLMGIALTLFTQPNASFTLLVFSFPYVAYRIWQQPVKSQLLCAAAIKLLRVAAFIAAVVVFLAVCFVLPPFYDVTHFRWDSKTSVLQAIVNVLLQGTWLGPCSPVLGVLVLVGCVYCIWKRKDLWWLVAVFAIVAVMYVVAASVDGRLKNYLSGFWYTDLHRISSMVAMISYPIGVAILGMTWERFANHFGSKPMIYSLGFAANLALLSILLLPSFTLPNGVYVETPFGSQRGLIRGYYSVDYGDEDNVFTAEERDFVRRASEITGDSLVMNMPIDGSMFAYQLDGMKTAYRYYLDMMDERTSYRLLQRNLDGIADDPSVRRAVDNLGVEYVLLLDQGHPPHSDSIWRPTIPTVWEGLSEIDDETPGFELVMSEGDMRLYRVLPEDGEADPSITE